MEIKLPKVNSKRWLDRTPLEGEEWKPVPDYEGMYEVSNYGRVYSILRFVDNGRGSLRKTGGRVLRIAVAKHGYSIVQVNRDSIPQTVRVHIVVAKAFIPNPNNYPMINHKDEVKTNNVFSNLEWCDAKYNNNYGTIRLRNSLKQKNNINSSRPVLQYTRDNQFVKEYPSAAEASRQTGLRQANICGVCRRVKNMFTIGGYKWKYKEDPMPIEDFPMPKFVCQKRRIGQFTMDGVFVASYESGEEAYKKTGILPGNILRCAKKYKNCHSAGGFRWEFSEC